MACSRTVLSSSPCGWPEGKSQPFIITVGVPVISSSRARSSPRSTSGIKLMVCHKWAIVKYRTASDSEAACGPG